MQTPPPMPQLTPRGKPLVLVGLMAALFIALVAVLIRYYGDYVADRPVGRAPAATRPAASAPAGPGAAEESWVPEQDGFAARNLALSGNLAPLAEMDGQPVAFDEATFRIAADVARADEAFFRSGSTRCPPLADLLAQPDPYRGRKLGLRVVPFAAYPHRHFFEGRPVDSWRIYAFPQTTSDQAVVFETLENPGAEAWTLKRSVLDVHGIFLRTATYADEKQRTRAVPYFLAKTFRPADAAESAPATGLHNLLFSKYGPLVALAVIVFVMLTVWTLRRSARQTERLERETFYTMLRARKRPHAPRGGAGQATPTGTPPNAAPGSNPAAPPGGAA